MGDAVEVLTARRGWLRWFVIVADPRAEAMYLAPVSDATGGIGYRFDEEGKTWRWPAAASGGGSLAQIRCNAPGVAPGDCDLYESSEGALCAPGLCMMPVPDAPEGGGCGDALCEAQHAEGGGSAEVTPEVRLHDFKPVPGGYAYECANCDQEISDMAPPALKMRLGVEACDGRKTKPEPPPAKRCPERVSAEGEAIEDCGTVVGPDVQCFVCLGARCYVHCGCLQHHKGAKVVHRGGQGSFEWAVWEFEHAFRGQLYAKAADGSGLVILGTHGGASSEAVLSILLRSLERIQGRKVRDTRGEVIGQSAKARPTNEAAGELRADNDPEFELHELDAKVVLLLEQSKRLHSAADEAIQKARLGVLGACTDWLRATEHVWRDLAEDPEQNPRLVWQAKELHDQQVADLFFRLGALFNGGAE